MDLINALFELATRPENAQGFTVRLLDLSRVTTGYAVAYEATQDSHTRDEIARCIEHAREHAGIVGGWLNEQDGKWYWDSTAVYNDRAEAIAAGRRENQIAIYDLDNDEVIFL